MDVGASFVSNGQVSKAVKPCDCPLTDPCRVAGPILVRTGEPYQDKVKLTFAKGAALADPGAGWNQRRAARLRRRKGAVLTGAEWE